MELIFLSTAKHPTAELDGTKLSQRGNAFPPWFPGLVTLGDTDESPEYSLQIISADFLAGANLDPNNQNQAALILSLCRAVEQLARHENSWRAGTSRE